MPACAEQNAMIKTASEVKHSLSDNIIAAL